ncbi:MAG: hypothetical protein MHMPM18_002047 [Marteilia pararefringens]
MPTDTTEAHNGTGRGAYRQHDIDKRSVVKNATIANFDGIKKPDVTTSRRLGSTEMNGSPPNKINNIPEDNRIMKSSFHFPMPYSNGNLNTPRRNLFNPPRRQINNPLKNGQVTNINKKFMFMPLDQKLSNPREYIIKNTNQDEEIKNRLTQDQVLSLSPVKDNFNKYTTNGDFPSRNFQNSDEKNSYVKNNLNKNLISPKSASNSILFENSRLSLPRINYSNVNELKKIHISDSRIKYSKPDIDSKRRDHSLSNSILNNNSAIYPESASTQSTETKENMQISPTITREVSDLPQSKTKIIQVEIYLLKSKISALKSIFKKLKAKFIRLLENEYKSSKRAILDLNSTSSNEKIINKKSILDRKLKRFDILRLMRQKMYRKTNQLSYKQVTPAHLGHRLMFLSNVLSHKTWSVASNLLDSLNSSPFYNTFVYSNLYKSSQAILNDKSKQIDINNYRLKDFTLDIPSDSISEDLLTISSFESSTSTLSSSKHTRPTSSKVSASRGAFLRHPETNSNYMSFSDPIHDSIESEIIHPLHNSSINGKNDDRIIQNFDSVSTLQPHLSQSSLNSSQSSSVIFSTEINGRIFSKGDKVYVLKQNHPMLAGRILTISESGLLIKGPSGRLKLSLEELKHSQTTSIVHNDQSLDT